jgi:hypothetical protein
MKTSAICLCAIVLLAGLLESASGQRRSDNQSQPSPAEQSVSKESKSKNALLACSLTALTPAQRERHKQLRGQMSGLVENIRELPDGYELQLPGETSAITAVAEWVTLERLCCPFFTFQLQIEGAGKPLLLRLTGPEGVKELLKSEFATK